MNRLRKQFPLVFIASVNLFLGTGYASVRQQETAIKPSADIQKLLDAAAKLSQVEERKAFIEAAISALKSKDYVGYDTAISSVRDLDMALGKIGDANAYLKSQIDAAKAASDTRAQACAMEALGELISATGKTSDAVPLYQAALKLRTESSDLYGQAECYNDLGQAYINMGRMDPAIANLKLTLEIDRKIKFRSGEADALNNLGLAYNYIGNNALALQNFKLAIPIYQEVKDRSGEACTLGNIGLAYDSLGDTHNAVQFDLKSLKIDEEIKDRRSQALQLYNLGVVYHKLGENQKSLDYYSKASPIIKELHITSYEGPLLNGMGVVYSEFGQTKLALECYEKALAVERKSGDRSYEATTLNSLGQFYSGMGQFQTGLEYYQKALTAQRLNKDRNGEANTLNCIANCYLDLDQQAKALGMFEMALRIRQDIKDKSGEAHSLTSIGGLYRNLGEYQLALEYFNNAFPLMREARSKIGEANTLAAISDVLLTRRHYKESVASAEAALALYRSIGTKWGEAAGLLQLGLANHSLHNDAQSIYDLNQALVLTNAIGDRDSEGRTLCDLASVYRDRKEFSTSFLKSELALPISREVHVEKFVAMELSIMAACTRKSAPIAAAWFESMAVRKSEAMKAGAHKLKSGDRRSFAETLEERYLTLADSLALMRRTAEFQQIMAMSKIDLTDEKAQAVPQTPIENRWTVQFERALDNVARLGSMAAKLKHQTKRTPDQDAELRRLNALREQAEKSFQTTVAYIVKESKRPAASRQRIASTPASQAVDLALKSMPKGSSFVYALLGKDKLHLLVVRRNRRVLKSIPASRMRPLIVAFREALGNPRIDPRPLGLKLYKLLVAPIADELSTNGVTMWSLSGVLRGIPIDALWDGKQFMLERLPSSSFSPAFVASLGKNAKVKGLSLVCGVEAKAEIADPVTKQPVYFGSLPGAAKEATLVGNALGVTPLIGSGFSEGKLQDALTKSPNVIHLASHFRYVPGDDRRSFLLTGDGGAWTVEAIKALGDRALQNVQLVTLSACATASDTTESGAESESFGAWMQRKGANSVISTLWPIADQSTASLMPEFYRLWKAHPQQGKLLALRCAQLEMLTGSTSAIGPRRERKRTAESLDSPDRTKGPAWPKSKPRFSHPYYWAPFVLTGNWQ